MASYKKQIFLKSFEPRGPDTGSLSADEGVFCGENFFHSCLTSPQPALYKQEDGEYERDLMASVTSVQARWTFSCTHSPRRERIPKLQ